MEGIWKYIKADSFFKDYLPFIRNYKRKISGRSGKGKPLDFSETEKQEIKSAINKLFQNLMQPSKTPQGVGKRGQKNNTK